MPRFGTPPPLGGRSPCPASSSKQIHAPGRGRLRHEDHGRGSRSMGAMATDVRPGGGRVATALAALTGAPHPLAIKDPGTGPADEYRH